MSDGLYDNMRAYILIKIKTDVDEASDIWYYWLVVKNTDNNNGNVGIWEYHTPGFMQLILIK
jgi:hypothetical protein